MKYNLTVVDRVILLNVLPKEGNMITLLSLRDLKAELVFSEEENDKLGVKMEDGNLMWNKDAEQEKAVEINGTMTKIIVEALLDMDKQGKLNEAMIDTCQKFIG